MYYDVLILCAHRPKRSPSQRYRFEQYLPFLEAQGFQFTFSYLLNEKDDVLFYSKGNVAAKAFILLKTIFIRIKDCFRFKKFDCIFIQREASFLGTSFFEKQAARSGATVIFDFDDSIWLADTSPGNKKWEWIKDAAKFFKNVALANIVIAGNAYLAEKARAVNKNTIVIPTTIDTSIHVPKPGTRNEEPGTGSGEYITIGWSGSISTIKHFELLVPVLLQLKEKFGNTIKFKVIGDPNYKNKLLNIEAVAWTENTEVDDLNSLDIGIMPLPDDEWANGKCGLKGLSYMACGVPTIMSAVGVNKEIISHGHNGFLAHNDTEWFDLLSSLIADENLRDLFSHNGRKTVLENYSVDANKEKYLQIFEQACKLHT